MTEHEIDRIQNAINHIKTATDVDPWAMDLAVEALEKELKNLSDGQSGVICGACDNSESDELYLTNPPQIKCKRSGKLHFVTDRCDLPPTQPKPDEKVHQEQGESAEFGGKIGKTCAYAISRQAAIDVIDYLLRHNDGAKRKGHSQVFINGMGDGYFRVRSDILSLPSVQPETIRCKDCKYFEYDHPYVIQGVPVLGHEICNAWGDGCKTNENGYCFLAERRTDG